jgi:flagellar basal-body rod protein FlgF
VSYSIYSALSGAKAAWTQMEVLANNLANVSTNGFKAQQVTLAEARVSPDALGNSYVKVAGSTHDMSDGPTVHTDVETHLALRGRGFFVVQGDDGPVMQRAGNFLVDNEGQLVNERGQPVLSDAGPIEIPERAGIHVAKDGTIRTLDGDELGKLRLVSAEAVQPMGMTQWKAVGGMIDIEEGEVQVVQGALERSNADPMKGMVELMEASRYFEAYQKAMQASDDLDARNNEMMRNQ